MRLLFHRQQTLPVPPPWLNLFRAVASVSQRWWEQIYRPQTSLSVPVFTDTSASIVPLTSTTNASHRESILASIPLLSNNSKMLQHNMVALKTPSAVSFQTAPRVPIKAKTPSYRSAPTVIWLVFTVIQNEPSPLPCLATPRLLAMFVSTGV